MDEISEQSENVEWALHDVIRYFCNAEQQPTVRALIGERAADAYLRKAKWSKWKVHAYRTLYVTSFLIGLQVAARLSGILPYNFWDTMVLIAICLLAFEWARRLRRSKHELHPEKLRSAAETDIQRRNIEAIVWLSRNFEAAGLKAFEDGPFVSHSGEKQPLPDSSIFARDNGLVLFLGDSLWESVRTKSYIPSAPIRVRWKPFRFADIQKLETASTKSEQQVPYSTRQLITGMTSAELSAHWDDFKQTVDWEDKTTEQRAQVYQLSLPFINTKPKAPTKTIAYDTLESMKAANIPNPPEIDIMNKLLGKSDHKDYGAFRKYLMSKGLKPKDGLGDDTQPDLL
jgi:hypothetical protein